MRSILPMKSLFAGGAILALASLSFAQIAPRQAPAASQRWDLTIRASADCFQSYRMTLEVTDGAPRTTSIGEGVMTTSPKEGGLYYLASRTQKGASLKGGRPEEHTLHPTAFRTVDEFGIPVSVNPSSAPEWRAILMSTIARPHGPVMIGEEWQWDLEADQEKGIGRILGDFRLARIEEAKQGPLAVVEFSLREKQGAAQVCSSKGRAWICPQTGALLKMSVEFKATPTREGVALSYRAELVQTPFAPLGGQAKGS